jgi:uncharacterized surface protein with fasciclin (FAS1) repeats
LGDKNYLASDPVKAPDVINSFANDFRRKIALGRAKVLLPLHDPSLSVAESRGDFLSTHPQIENQLVHLMIRSFRFAILGLALSASAAFAANPMVGGKEMFPTKNIIENAVNSADHTTLVAAVKAAGLVETLSGKGPFTVFAPTNEAFGKLPKGTVETLLKPENKAKLTGILTYHVVAGKVSAAALMKKIKAGKGKAVLTTVNGEKLTAMMSGDGKGIVLKDTKGGEAMVTIADVNQSNGVIHVIDHVLLP